MSPSSLIRPCAFWLVTACLAAASCSRKSDEASSGQASAASPAAVEAGGPPPVAPGRSQVEPSATAGDALPEAWGAGVRAAAGPAPSPGAGPAPTLKLGEPTVSGGVPGEVVRRIVGQHRGRIRQCYEAALGARPGLEGSMTIAFVVGPDGSVRSAEVAGDDTGDPELGSCVAGIVREMRFPATDGSTSCSCPLAFRLVGGEG